ncbi:hypothetical protein [Mesorhizobium sp. M0843]|uniref:hypothetical protein n=1 Tax=Mesorhizobium sp. M0843 TaxID=2957010 RepID=UPI00333A6161
MPHTDKPEEPKQQIDKFREAAQKLRGDQSDAAFESAVEKIAHAPKLTNEEIKELVRRNRDQNKS